MARDTAPMSDSAPAEYVSPDTMASFAQTPKWRPQIFTRFGPRLVYVGADGRQVALQLTEADLWVLGQEVAAALLLLRSTPEC